MKIQHYNIEDKIAAGSFGTVYKATHIITQQKAAIKLAEKCENISTIINEAKILLYLQKKMEQIPKLYLYGTIPLENIDYLILELLGPNLCSVTIDDDHLSTIVLSMFHAIQQLHECTFIHRDIKPDNFLLRNENEVVLIDFGFSKSYLNDDNSHIHDKKTEHVIGTKCYLSYHGLHKNECSRRDDLESFIYCIFYLLLDQPSKEIPWYCLENESDIISFKKLSFLSSLFPKELYLLIEEIRNYSFTECPDYSSIEQKCIHFLS